MGQTYFRANLGFFSCQKFCTMCRSCDLLHSSCPWEQLYSPGKAVRIDSSHKHLCVNAFFTTQNAGWVGVFAWMCDNRARNISSTGAWFGVAVLSFLLCFPKTYTQKKHKYWSVCNKSESCQKRAEVHVYFPSCCTMYPDLVLQRKGRDRLSSATIKESSLYCCFSWLIGSEILMS